MSNGFAIDMTSSLSLETSTAQVICELIDSPRSLAVWLLIQYGEFKQLLELDINPDDYQDHSNFADDYLATELLSKSPNLPVGIDRKQVALESFFDSEQRCRASNERILSASELPKAVSKAKRLVRKVLGPLTRADLDYVESSFRFGPGATTGVRGSGSVLSDKYDEEIHLTHSLIPFYRSMIGNTWWEYKKSPLVVEGNRFTTVPKNAKTDRGICIEPTLNIYGQLGVGALLRRRLKRLGVDLADQTRNQRLAQKAYAEDLATIDLSAASDSLCWAAVMEFLPNDWFELLDVFRSTHSEVEGEFIELEKFSSMGNGYTFELESLIFAAIALSVVPLHDHHLVGVYGDDIIVPQYATGDVIDALEFLGFRVNQKKSFLAGSFFESCGSDWFKGQPVRPFYLRGDNGDGLPYVLQIANALRVYSNLRLGGIACDARFKPIWMALFKRVPRIWRKCRVPASLGDSGIISSLEEAKPHINRSEYGWEGWTVLHMRFKPLYRRKKSLGRLLSALACPVTEIASHGREPKRGFLGRPRPRSTTVSQWCEGYSWC